jgi:hypothetical protein
MLVAAVVEATFLQIWEVVAVVVLQVPLLRVQVLQVHQILAVAVAVVLEEDPMEALVVLVVQVLL